jgi:hypothetical protein
MAAADPVAILATLCEIDPPQISWDDINDPVERAGFEILAAAGALVEAGRRRQILCTACESPHSIAVEYAGDGAYRAYCHDTGYQSVPAEDLRLLSLNEGWNDGADVALVDSETERRRGDDKIEVALRPSVDHLFPRGRLGVASEDCEPMVTASTKFFVQVLSRGDACRVHNGRSRAEIYRA